MQNIVGHVYHQQVAHEAWGDKAQNCDYRVNDTKPKREFAG